jgi:polysaccharide biosynthesis transport protein
MELREYTAIARKWLWLFVLATVVAAVSAWVATRFMPRQYRSQTTMMVGRGTADPNPEYTAFYLSQGLAESYAQMATREPVLSGVVHALGLSTDWEVLKGMVQAKAVPGSQLFEVTVVDTNPLRAQAIADEVARQIIASSPNPTAADKAQNGAFVTTERADLRTKIEAARKEVADLDAKIGLETSARAIADLQNRKQARETQIESWRLQYTGLLNTIEGGEVNSVAVIEQAAPGLLVGPNVGMNVLLAALIGFGLALGAVLLLEYLDDTVKTSDQVERRLGLVGLSTIARMEGVVSQADALVTLRAARSPMAEAFRTLRTNLQFSIQRKRRRLLLVTSANPGEGKSTVAANLAVVIAQRGLKVILVDADLRRPAVHRLFQLPNSLGMTSLLMDDGLTPADALRPIDAVAGLSVLTSGPLPPNPSEVLDSDEMDQLLAALSERADVVIVDSPPLLAVTDPAVLAQKLDATLLVLDAGTTRVDAARKAVDVLEKVNVTPLGAVINRQDRRLASGTADAYRYTYDYSGYYGDGPDAGDDDRPAGRPAPRPRPAVGWMARVRAAMTSFLG